MYQVSVRHPSYINTHETTKIKIIGARLSMSAICIMARTENNAHMRYKESYWRCACLQPTPTMQSPISFSLNLERGRSGTRGRFVAGRSVPARPFAYAIVIHLFIQIPDYNHLMPTFIVAAALCCRRCVSPWHACVVASSDKKLRALRRASCDRTQPMRSLFRLISLGHVCVSGHVDV